MNTQQLRFMPAKLSLQGIALKAKQVGITALALLLAYTTYGQNSNKLTFTTGFSRNDVKNGELGLMVKLDKGNIANYTPEALTVNVNGHSKSLSIKTILIKGDYLLMNIDASDLVTDALLIDDNGGNGGGSSGDSKLVLIGTMKEITIDNVSGVMLDNDHGSASVVVIDLKDMTAIADGNSAGSPVFVSTGQGVGSNNASGTDTRGDDIITKDEVQGFVSAYPNPSHGFVKIKSSHSKLIIQEINVINAIGAKVLTQRPSDDGHLVQIDTQTIPAGIYFLQIKTNVSDIVKRIVVVD